MAFNAVAARPPLDGPVDSPGLSAVDPSGRCAGRALGRPVAEVAAARMAAFPGGVPVAAATGGGADQDVAAAELVASVAVRGGDERPRATTPAGEVTDAHLGQGSDRQPGPGRR